MSKHAFLESFSKIASKYLYNLPLFASGLVQMIFLPQPAGKKLTFCAKPFYSDIFKQEIKGISNVCLDVKFGV